MSWGCCDFTEAVIEMFRDRGLLTSEQAFNEDLSETATLIGIALAGGSFDCDAKTTKGKPTTCDHFLLVIHGDVEPLVIAYDNAEERDQGAGAWRNKYGDEDGLYRLGWDEISGEPSVRAYGGAELEKLANQSWVRT